MEDYTIPQLSSAIDGMKRIKKEFTVGKKYIVSGSGYYGKGNHTLDGTSWDNKVVFEYTGKQGIHHCFRSVLGGWSRTYTDYQLIGKKIREVNNNGISNNARI